MTIWTLNNWDTVDADRITNTMLSAIAWTAIGDDTISASIHPDYRPASLFGCYRFQIVSERGVAAEYGQAVAVCYPDSDYPIQMWITAGGDPSVVEVGDFRGNNDVGYEDAIEDAIRGYLEDTGVTLDESPDPWL